MSPCHDPAVTISFACSDAANCCSQIVSIYKKQRSQLRNFLPKLRVCTFRFEFAGLIILAVGAHKSALAPFNIGALCRVVLLNNWLRCGAEQVARDLQSVPGVVDHGLVVNTA